MSLGCFIGVAFFAPLQHVQIFSEQKISLSLSLSIATREIQNRRYSKKFYDNNIFYDNIMIMVISE